MITWQDTLSVFNAVANEEQRVVEHFENNVLPVLIERAPADAGLSWLDIGPGDGGKTRLMLDLLRSQQSKLGLISAILLEPHAYWRERLRKQPVGRATEEVTVIGQQLSDFARENPADQFDLITLVHVLYDQMLAAEVLNWVQEAKHQQRPLVYMVMEDPQFDMSSLKAQIRTCGVAVPETQFGFVMAELKARGIPYLELEIPDQRVMIDPAELARDSTHWLFPFVLGLSLSDYGQLASEARECVQRVTRSYVSSLGRDFLKIDDKAFIIGTNIL